jgi:uncharacterized protein (TIGR01777 family)
MGDTARSGHGKLLVTGATGFIGRRMVAAWPGEVVVTSRDPSRAAAELGLDVADVIEWNPDGLIDLRSCGPITAVVNLMGHSIIAGRWTDARKAKIRTSRVAGTRNLVAALARLASPPSLLVSMSAVGLYGSRGDDVVTESSETGSGFLADVCCEWEAAAQSYSEIGRRVVVLRLGIVLGRGGGMLHSLRPIFRWGLGARLGTGAQWMSWIHVEDVVGLIIKCISDPSWEGPFNAVAPHPVTNRQFTRELAGAVRRPALLAVPRWAIRLGMGEMHSAMISSQRAVPQRALAAGFYFRFPHLADALSDIVT